MSVHIDISLDGVTLFKHSNASSLVFNLQLQLFLTASMSSTDPLHTVKKTSQHGYQQDCVCSTRAASPEKIRPLETMSIYSESWKLESSFWDKDDQVFVLTILTSPRDLDESTTTVQQHVKYAVIRSLTCVSSSCCCLSFDFSKDFQPHSLNCCLSGVSH